MLKAALRWNTMLSSLRQAALWVMVGASVGACDPNALDLVGAPGGVYRPGQGCALREGASACPAPADPGAPQLRFESEAGAAAFSFPASTRTLSNLRVSCRHSYCGTGSLAFHADLHWTAPQADDTERAGTIVYTFDRPVDLAGRTVGFSVFIENPTAALQAQVGVIYQYWRRVAWKGLPGSWQRIEGVVSPDNPNTGIAQSVTSIPVTALQIDVYLEVNPLNGGKDAWSGEVYVDDVSW